MAEYKIMLIEDDEHIRESLQIRLEMEGHKVDAFCCGNDAMSSIEGKTYDFVITDIVMNDGDGFEVIRSIRKLERRPKLIGISGGGRMSGEDYLHLSKKLGVDATLMKPFRHDELLTTLSELSG